MDIHCGEVVHLWLVCKTSKRVLHWLQHWLGVYNVQWSCADKIKTPKRIGLDLGEGLLFEEHSTKKITELWNRTEFSRTVPHPLSSTAPPTFVCEFKPSPCDRVVIWIFNPVSQFGDFHSTCIANHTNCMVIWKKIKSNRKGVLQSAYKKLKILNVYNLNNPFTGHL